MHSNSRICHNESNDTGKCELDVYSNILHRLHMKQDSLNQIDEVVVMNGIDFVI